MNKVIVSGNLVRDCEIRTTDSGASVVSNSVAVKRDFKNANGEYDTDFINFNAWGGSAEYLSKYAHKGDRVEIVGRWQNRQYENKEGVNVTVSEIIVESIYVNSNKGATVEKEEVNQVSEEDLPF